eukprot:CAMPEP_0177743646 /NCGR_PEP_ID=MMETSP0484_2-20121128/29305_1 /TAXON_ID=354590 /ORGANISM="Rhodomonas lens, Strain RHODO" /LENGTH=62 /DNA_ID=CAMNT_0019258059 /DNA_START=17 /DNA_END=202 /DNA_ORIENTATION=-
MEALVKMGEVSEEARACFESLELKQLLVASMLSSDDLLVLNAIELAEMLPIQVLEMSAVCSL